MASCWYTSLVVLTCVWRPGHAVRAATLLVWRARCAHAGSAHPPAFSLPSSRTCYLEYQIMM